MIVQKINMHISTEERGWKAFKMDSAVWEAEKRCKPLQKSLKFLSHAKIVNFTRLKYEVWKVAIFDIISTNELETDRFRRQYDEMERYLTYYGTFFENSRRYTNYYSRLDMIWRLATVESIRLYRL